MATNTSAEIEEVPTNNQDNGEISTLLEEREQINEEIATALDEMCEQTETSYKFSPIQRYLLRNVTKITLHVIQPNGKLYFQVEFDSYEFGGSRWMSSTCMRYRPELVAQYWNERALRKYRKFEARRHLLNMETTVFGIYDF